MQKLSVPAAPRRAQPRLALPRIESSTWTAFGSTLTILVIAHHVGQAYGPTGGYWPVQEAARASILGPFFTVNRSFFMSLFFMVSGYFMVGAYQRNGFGAFIRGRLVRLGVPVLAFAALMLPVADLSLPTSTSRAGTITSTRRTSGTWSTCCSSASSMRSGRTPRRTTRRQSRKHGRRRGCPDHVAALLLVAVACGIVRIWFPIDRWMNLLGFFRVAFSDVPRDLAFFIFGAMAFRRGWFEGFSTPQGTGLACRLAWWPLSPCMPGG